MMITAGILIAGRKNRYERTAFRICCALSFCTNIKQLSAGDLIMHSLTEWEQSCCNIVRYYLRAGNIISDALTDE